MTLSDHLRPEAVLLDLPARTKADVLEALADRAAGLLGCEAGAILRALTERERLGSTGVGSGVALPHAAAIGTSEPVALVARLSKPIDWEAIDDRPVDLVGVVLSPSDGPGSSTNLLAKFARLLRSEDRRTRLRHCRDAAAFHRVLVETAD